MKFFSCLFIFAIIMAAFVQLVPAKPASADFLAVTAPPQKKCAEVGEFCRVSENCCSKLCLTFGARCVANHA